jgi:hypothetical protein
MVQAPTCFGARTAVFVGCGPASAIAPVDTDSVSAKTAPATIPRAGL